MAAKARSKSIGKALLQRMKQRFLEPVRISTEVTGRSLAPFPVGATRYYDLGASGAASIFFILCFM